MKTLLLMRHAKSSWKLEGQPDHDRPLNDRGKRDAPRMGRLLKQEGIQPDLILTSSAKRARKTASAVAEVLGAPDSVQVREDLYGAGPDVYVAILRNLPDDVATAMIVAHDPTISTVVSALTQHYTEMPTAAIASFRVPVPRWSDFALSLHCPLANLWLPRELPE